MPLWTPLTDKHAAQPVRYPAVEGVERAALTNGREPPFFDTFLKPDLEAKRVLRRDQLAFNTDAEFDALFAQVWQLPGECMAAAAGAPPGSRSAALTPRCVPWLLDPASPALTLPRRQVARAEVAATTHDLAAWFRAHLASPLAVRPVPVADESKGNAGKEPPQPTTGAGDEEEPCRRVTLRDPVDAGLLRAGTELVLVEANRREVARATLEPAGEIAWEGRAYWSPSDRAFSRRLGRSAVNGWTHWHSELPAGRVPIAEVRARMDSAEGDGHRVQRAGANTGS